MLRIGTGGIPLTSINRTTEAGIKRLHELGLNHLELEFVKNVYLKEEVTASVKQVAKENDVSLTIHAPYYINLASDEKRIYYSSINHISKSLYIGGLIGAKSVTFHSAYFQKQDPTIVAEKVFIALQEIKEDLTKKTSKQKNFISPVIAPELTGKPSQFGGLEELIELAKNTSGDKFQASICIDFAHYFARTNAVYNTYDQFMETLQQVVTGLGEKALQNLHMHLSGIIHSAKGERHHVTLLESLKQYQDNDVVIEGIESEFELLINKDKNGGSQFDWRGVLKALKVSGAGGYLVCESPILELDALLMKGIYDSL